MSDPHPSYLRQLHDDGMTWSEVARETGLTKEAVRGRVKRHKKALGEGRNIPKLDISGIEELNLDEAMEIADRLGEIMDVIDPIITDKDLYFPPKPIAIMFSSCAHIGGRYTWHREVRDIFNTILETDGLYLGLLGDEPEGFLPGFRDARAVTDQVLPIKAQIAILGAYLKLWSEKGKCLFGCHSQHGGGWFEKLVGLNPIKDEFRETKTPYFEGRGIVKLWLGEERFVIPVAHSFKGTSIYNPNHAQRRATLFDYPSADLCVQGDRHRYAVQQMSDRVDEFLAGLRPSPKVWHVQVGTAKIGSDPYTIRGWQHGFFEWPTFVFYPEEHRIKQCFELRDLKWMLKQ